MCENPFLSSSSLNIPFQREVCQRIHYAALRAATRGLLPDSVPNHISVAQLRQEIHWHGANAHLSHPADIERIFEGVTLAVYQAVDDLYCSRLGRSIEMVWRILAAMADEAAVPEISYETVWAICLYLERRRQSRTEVTVKQMETAWIIAQIEPDLRIRDADASIYKPTVICVLDTSSPRVLAFRIVKPGKPEKYIPLALYDAVVSQRRPSSDGTAGLIWRIPTRVVAETDLPEDCQLACDRIDIGVELSRDNNLPLLAALRGDWDRDLSGQVLRRDRFAMLFDNYLDKFHGYAPVLTARWLDWDYSHLVGYNRDPAWQFPALRGFLPAHRSTITEDGAVECDGLHHEHDLMAYWTDHQVTLRRSETSEAVAWIYLDGEVLCRAMARELRRQDGSYRPNRPGR